MPKNHSFPAVTLAALLAACGGDEPGPPAAAPDGGAAPVGDLAAAIAQYEMGALSLADLRARAAAAPAATEPPAGSVTGTVVLGARAYTLAANLVVPDGALLVLAPGASLTIGGNVGVEVRGKLYALGAKDRPVTIAGTREAPYRTISLLGARSELHGVTAAWAASLFTVKGTKKTPILIADGKLDNWRTSAVEMDDADALVIRGNQIGVETLPQDARSEALHGAQSAVRVEGNVFGRRTGYNDVFDLQPCKDGHFPVIVGNRFLGGDDDALDLDTCDAIVVGNHFKDFRPDPATAMGAANGGGVTGAGDTRPLVVNNVFENMVHAIGFKDGARPTILNNTIINSDIGLTLYSADGKAPAATAIAINNVFWNNKEDVRLDGGWFKDYDPNLKGALDASYNVIRDAGLADRDGNRGEDPRLEVRDGLPHLGAGSPARGTGQGDLAALAATTIFPMDALKAWLEKDYLGTPRPFAGGKFTIDRGALQGR